MAEVVNPQELHNDPIEDVPNLTGDDPEAVTVSLILLLQ
jgi:hypothetical protein